MIPERRAELVLLRRARDLIDRRFAEPLDVPAIAAAVHLSAAHFSRRFHSVYGETPYQYLMTRRIERACAMLRAGASVTEACMAVGASSLGSFSSRFTDIVGTTPSAYRAAEHPAEAQMPDCAARVLTRPRRTSRIGEAAGTPAS
ncbi:helix-turn-helix transcriptional regulator [Amnibacterium sp.]|uniref:helix-turn-helix transcriptional regulator n=1 Tax=Amnibacterium sp. TaxID=1872496 RepID=UPI003F7C817A